MTRPSANARGYDSKWNRESKAYLQANPICVMCGKRVKLRSHRGDPEVGVVDHIEPHKGSHRLFWSRSNWQTLHKGCHDGPKQHYERTGRVRGCDEDGVPLDEGHHWKGTGPGGQNGN